MNVAGTSKAVLLCHTGHGPRHYDLVIEAGQRCPTLALIPGHPWRWRWQAPHRRRYLTYRGGVSGGRGSVRRVWTGCVRLVHGSVALMGLRLRLRRDGVVVGIDPTHSPPCLR